MDQPPLWIATSDLPTSPGHPFYARLTTLLDGHHFDRFVEGLCDRFYAPVMGRPSLAPGRYFRLLLVGYFEGIDSERGTSGNPEQSLLVQEVGAHRVVLLVRGRQVERTALSEWPNTFWIAVLAILETGGHRLARCLRPECCPVFVRMRRQQYCSPRCSQIMRSRRWYAAHRPEAQRRRREAYQAQVKTVYPRAKVATRTRRARRQ